MSSLSTLTSSPMSAGVWAGLLGLGLWFAPTGLRDAVRGMVGDGLQPGLHLVQSSNQYTQAWWDRRRSREVQQLRQQLAEQTAARVLAEERSRRLTAQAALALAAAEQGRPPTAESASTPLFTPALIEARILGDTLAQQWRTGKFLDQGSRHGVRESALVLASSQPLIDLGRREQVAPEDLLLVGQTILGKLETVGRWTSTFLPVSDRDFRGKAQIVRISDRGAEWGAEGLLRGTGNACELAGVRATEPVAIGDYVMTAARDSWFSAPLVYGQVTRLEHEPGALEWTIEVSPGLGDAVITEVRVLRASLHPGRLWSH